MKDIKPERYNAEEKTIFESDDKILEFLTDILDFEDILKLRPSEKIQARVSQPIAGKKSRDGIVSARRDGMGTL